ARIVCVLPATGGRYRTKIYNDEWMRENRMMEPERMTAGDMLARKDGGPPLIAVEPGTPVRQALSLITTHDVSQLPILREGDCVGSVSEATLMARVIEDPAILDRPIEMLMEAPFPVIDAGVELAGVARLLTRQNSAVLIRVNGELAGIVTRFDMVRHMMR